MESLVHGHAATFGYGTFGTLPTLVMVPWSIFGIFVGAHYFVILNSFEFKTQRMRRRNRPWRHDKALAMSQIFRNQTLEHVHVQESP